MSRRGRAIAFASAAAICAGLAAGATQGPSADLASQGGVLREALVASATLEARVAIRRVDLKRAVEVRRVPASFLPPDALTAPEQVAGRRPAVTVPAGSYVLESQFTAPRAKPDAEPAEAADPGDRAVEITVTGAGALAAAPPQRVDVIVTTEPGPGGGPGRTYVAAAGVELLALSAADADAAGDVVPGPATDAWAATLALTRAQALRLIQAESFARTVRLIER
jgi:Flp pilus assembly protein CpaB